INFLWQGYENAALTKDFIKLCRSLDMKGISIHASDYAYRRQIENVINKLKPEILVPFQIEGAEIFREMHGNVIEPCDDVVAI
ncbi:MAG: hypothetical protein FWG53_07470, partial [Clostridiales bacterium]|nr:hypothetical protein [Clostridiales bacterium]